MSTISLTTLEQKYSQKTAEEILQSFVLEEFKDKVALVSSFGIEAALLLSMVSEVDPATPVIFLDTQKLFSETLEYRDKLITHLNLSNVKTYFPDYVDIERDDAKGELWKSAPNSCCYIRKVKPLNKALKGMKAWITGRKRFHGGLRTSLPLLEFSEGRVKLNPLASWSAEDINEAFKNKNLPPHPLLEKGYTSIGCIPCTALPEEEGARSGRWRDQDKTECGIHLDEDGKLKRSHG